MYILRPLIIFRALSNISSHPNRPHLQHYPPPARPFSQFLSSTRLSFTTSRRISFSRRIFPFAISSFLSAFLFFFFFLARFFLFGLHTFLIPFFRFPPYLLSSSHCLERTWVGLASINVIPQIIRTNANHNFFVSAPFFPSLFSISSLSHVLSFSCSV